MGATRSIDAAAWTGSEMAPVASSAAAVTIQLSTDAPSGVRTLPRRSNRHDVDDGVPPAPPESSGTTSPLNSPSSTSVWRNPAGVVSDDAWVAGMVSVTGAARKSRCVPGGHRSSTTPSCDAVRPICGCPTATLDPDVIAVSGTSTSTKRPDEPDRQAPGCPGGGRRRDRRGTAGVRKPVEPAATSTRRSDGGPTSPSGRVSSQLGPGRGADPQPIQASGTTMSAQPSASMSPSGAYSGCWLNAAFSRLSAASRPSDAEPPGNGWTVGAVDLDPAVHPRHPSGAELARGRVVGRLQPAHGRARLARRRARRERDGPRSRDGHRPEAVARIDDPQARIGGDDAPRSGRHHPHRARAAWPATGSRWPSPPSRSRDPRGRHRR